MVAAGSLSLLSLPNLLAIDGSEPIVIGELPLGGIGVSGSSPENDGNVARVGAAALQNERPQS
jgi:uncharacterized protein GlcG (DUF336 family)